MIFICLKKEKPGSISTKVFSMDNVLRLDFFPILQYTKASSSTIVTSENGVKFCYKNIEVTLLSALVPA